jgi:pSer/pThr/pTyr-binding forkhead associated (FHA) protein
MTVELIAVRDSESLNMEYLPAVIAPGRDAPLEVCELPDSACHCLISRIGDQLVVWDLGSRGGTFVNGARVTKATLRGGDRLRLGGTEFRVQSSERRQRYMHGVRT